MSETGQKGKGGVPGWWMRLWDGLSPTFRGVVIGVLLVVLVLLGLGLDGVWIRANATARRPAELESLRGEISRLVAEELRARSAVDDDRAERILAGCARITQAGAEMSEASVELVRTLMAWDDNRESLPGLRRIEAGFYRAKGELSEGVDAIKKVASEIRGGG